jgi:hypothetical protein
MMSFEWIDPTADKLAALYEQKFGGKENGRYRISTKLVRDVAGRKRLYADDMESLARALTERGFVLIDMDSFCVVMSANSFVNYRRANEDILK